MQPDQTAPLITVLTTHGDDVEGLIATARSVRRQTYPRIEYIVVGRGLGEDAAPALRNMASLFDTTMECAGETIYGSINAGIARASGEWLMLLDAGSVFADDDVVGELVASLTDTDEIIHGDALDGPSGLPRRFPYEQLYWAGMTFDRQAVMARAALFADYAFDPAYGLAADFQFFSRCRLAGRRFRRIARAVCETSANGEVAADALTRLRERHEISRIMFPGKPIDEQLLCQLP